jgi:hypothetical protein
MLIINMELNNMNNMTEIKARIETVKAHLMIAKLHNNENRIKQFSDELEALTNTAIVTEIDNIWSK